MHQECFITLKDMQNKQTGFIQYRCGLVNTEVKVKKLKKYLQLTYYNVATIVNNHDNDDVQKWTEMQATYRIIRPEATSKLEKNNGDVSNITKKRSCLSFFTVFFKLKKEKEKKKLCLQSESRWRRKIQESFHCQF
jgi:hypothetical protein